MNPNHHLPHSPSRYSYPQPPSSYYPRQPLPIDVDALAAGVQRYIPQAYIALPPGVDPATVDFRTFYPYNPSEVKHRKRTTRGQLKVLEDTFRHETKPNATLRKALAAQLEMTPRGVQVWFQNRRAKEKALAKKALSSDKKTPTLDGDADLDGNDEDDIPTVDSAGNEEMSPTATELLQSMSPDASPEPHPSSHSPIETPSPTTAPPTPVDEPSPKRESGPSPTGLGLSRRSWQAPIRPAAEANKSPGATSSPGASANEDDGIVNLRRGSLPTNFGAGAAGGVVPPSAFRVRSCGNGVNVSVGPGGTIGFDPFARRLSLDRLASHPYAHLAVAANGAVFGPARTPSHPHARLPIGPKTPLHTPQAHRLELPATIGLPLHARVHPNPGDCRPELMHRASMPAQPLHTPRSSEFAHPPPTAYRMRFPQEGHMYALSSRSYQAPIPGPLPAPDFSFGTSVSTPSSSESDGDAGGLNTFAFPREGDLDNEAEEESSASYDAFSSRFGSIASVAGSESSSTSAYYSEVSSFEMRPSTSQSHQNMGSDPYEDGRRLSCTGQILDLFSNLDVENASSSSLDVSATEPSSMVHHVGATGNNGDMNGGEKTTTYSSPSSTVSGGSGDNGGIPISQSSELAFALQHARSLTLKQSDGRHGITHEHSGDSSTSDSYNGGGDSDSASFTHSHRSSSSGSSLQYPLSASSSSSSLGLVPPRLGLDIPDKFVFDNGIEVVSVTGHYSPVSNPVSASFDFPPMPIDLHLHAHSSLHSHGSTMEAHSHHHPPPPPSNHYHGGEEDYIKLHDAMEYTLDSSNLTITSDGHYAYYN